MRTVNVRNWSTAVIVALFCTFLNLPASWASVEAPAIIEPPSLQLSLGQGISTSFVAKDISNSPISPTPSFSFSGTIPGISFAPSGALTGTPTVAGTFSIVVEATNVTGSVVSNFDFFVSHYAPSQITGDWPEVLVGGEGTSIQLIFSSSPSASWTVSAGALPSGMNIHTSSGLVSGTPITPATQSAHPEGFYSYSFTVQASNFSSEFGGATVSRVIEGYVTDGRPLRVSPDSISPMVAGTTIAVQFEAVATGVPSWTISSGAIPSGLTFTNGGLLVGTPSSPGTFSFEVKVQNNLGSATKSYMATVSAKAPTTLSPSSFGDLYLAKPFSVTISSDAFPLATFTISNGALPTGLSLNSISGQITGTPAVSGQAYSFKISAMNSGGTFESGLFQGTVLSGEVTTISPSSLGTSGNIPGGVPFEQILTANGFSEPTFAVTAGSLPTGLTLSGSVIAGTPTTTGSYNVTITATSLRPDPSNPGSSLSSQLSVIYSGNIIENGPSSISPEVFPAAKTGITYSATLSAFGLPTPVFRVISGSLPNGLTLSGSVISGVPSLAGTFSFVVQASNTISGTAAVSTKSMQLRVLSTQCPTSLCQFDNAGIRFGAEANERSLNEQNGLLLQPWYWNGTRSQWEKLTYSTRPLEMAIGTGASSSHWSRTTVAIINSAIAGTVRVDYSEFVPIRTSGSVTKGYGKIVWVGNFSINGQILEVTQTYSLGRTNSFAQAETKVRNISDSIIRNLHVWLGTGDDYVGPSSQVYNNTPYYGDQPVKQKGNLDPVSGLFSTISSISQPAKALRVISGRDVALFYSTTPGTNMAFNSCCSFSNAYNQNPYSNSAALSGDSRFLDGVSTQNYDGSYAAILPAGDISVSEQTKIDWFYAAGDIGDIQQIASSVATAAAPPAPRVTRGNAQALVEWDEPQSDDPIVDYEVRFSSNNGSTWTTVTRSPSTELSQLVTNLNNGTTYLFAIRAITTPVGTSDRIEGAWSNVSAPALIGFPDAPTLSSAVGGDGKVTLTFVAPASPISPVINYQVSVDGGNNWITRSPASIATSWVLSNLQNGQQFDIKVRALNEFGPGYASNTIRAVTKPVWVETSIKKLAVNKSIGSESVSATASVSYQITSGSLPTGLNLSSTGAISGIPTSEGTYSFVIKASNEAGFIEQSYSNVYVSLFGWNPTTVTYSMNTLTAVDIRISSSEAVGLDLTAGASLTINSLPAGLNASYLSANSANQFPSVRITGTPTTAGSYSRTITVTDSQGRSDLRTLIFEVVQGAPSVPQIAEATSAGGDTKIYYSLASNGAGSLLRFEYQINGGSWSALDGSQLTSPLTIPGLADGNLYNLKIRAVNTLGTSQESATFTIASKPTWIDSSLGEIKKGQTYSDAVSASASLSFTISAGSLPQGLSFDASTGQIVGTATNDETYDFTIKASNASGFITLRFTGATFEVSTASSPVYSSGVDPRSLGLPSIPAVQKVGSGWIEGREFSSPWRFNSTRTSGTWNFEKINLEISQPAAAGGYRNLGTEDIPIIIRGQEFGIDITGIPADSKIDFWLFSKPQVLGVSRSNSQGALQKTLIIDSETPTGFHTVQLIVHDENLARKIYLNVPIYVAEVRIKAIYFEIAGVPGSRTLSGSQARELSSKLRDANLVGFILSANINGISERTRTPVLGRSQGLEAARIIGSQASRLYPTLITRYFGTSLPYRDRRDVVRLRVNVETLQY